MINNTLNMLVITERLTNTRLEKGSKRKSEINENA
jgi:hypothetical protein